MGIWISKIKVQIVYQRVLDHPQFAQMDDFIRETKHRPYQLDDIERKFLCTQLPTFLDYRQVIPFVSDDLASIEFRAPGILHDYAAVKCIEPDTLQQLVGNSPLPSAEATPPLLAAYIEHVKPPKGKEVLSFFLHGQRRRNLSDHVNALTSDEAERKRIYSAIQSFQVPPHMSMKDIVPSIGNMVQTLEITKRGEAPEPIARKTAPAAVIDEDEEDEKDIALHIPEAKPFSEQEHWENPVLKQFKIDAGLSTRFSSEKTIKQVLVGTCAPHLVDLLDLGKFQTAVPVGESLDLHTIETFPLSYIDHLSNAKIAEICATPEAQSLYRGLLVKPKDGREWVKTLLLQYHPSIGRYVQTFKNYKKEPQLSAEIVKKIL